ncbi:MAG: hypothetical protein IPM80_23470 [Proteobacteria bacterium]|nr:hypothetical protein [Pseudomonadota bacterium]
MDSQLGERAESLTQRILITLSTLEAWVRCIDEYTQSGTKQQTLLCAEFAKEWGLVDATASTHHLRRCIRRIASDIRSALNSGSSDGLSKIIEGDAAAYGTHVLDVSTRNIEMFRDVLGGDSVPERWFVCYDELELAPDWLQTELLTSLREQIKTYI